MCAKVSCSRTQAPWFPPAGLKPTICSITEVLSHCTMPWGNSTPHEFYKWWQECTVLNPFKSSKAMVHVVDLLKINAASRTLWWFETESTLSPFFVMDISNCKCVFSYMNKLVCPDCVQKIYPMFQISTYIIIQFQQPTLPPDVW